MLENEDSTNQSEESTPPLSAEAEAILNCLDILSRAANALSGTGLMMRDHEVKLLYLAVTSRVLQRPVSVVVKGQSSAGKSYVVNKTLELFPPEAFYARTVMSPTALKYTPESFVHRMLVIYEADGLPSGTGEMLIRSLLSEGHISYDVTVADDHGKFTTQTGCKEGPTGLLLTTTRDRVHAENETRLISLELRDSPDITKAIMRSAATPHPELDVEPWHEMQRWLATAEHRVVISFAEPLVDLIPPRSARLTRDVPTLLSLIKSNAILHQRTRDRDTDGHIMATLEDYGVVREIYGPLLDQGVEASVPDEVRETVAALKSYQATTSLEATQADVLAELNRGRPQPLDKSTVSRRVNRAIELGYVRNLETRGPGYEARLVVGESMPSDGALLPNVEELQAAIEKEDATA